MRKFAHWLFPVITAFVAVFIVMFFIEINPKVPLQSEEGKQETSADSIDEKIDGGWISRFNTRGEKEYFYPVNEVSMKLDTNQSTHTQKIYHLVVPLKDSYEFFCLKQELENYDLTYLMNQSGEEKMTVRIDSPNQAVLQELVEKLKTYQISATLTP